MIDREKLHYLYVLENTRGFTDLTAAVMIKRNIPAFFVLNAIHQNRLNVLYFRVSLFKKKFKYVHTYFIYTTEEHDRITHNTIITIIVVVDSPINTNNIFTVIQWPNRNRNTQEKIGRKNRYYAT